jgi:hypothetical protein
MKLALLIVGIAAFLGFAAPAHADNDSYLAAVNALGLNSKLGPEGLLQAGKGACGMLEPSPGLMFGLHPNRVADIVWQGNPLLERDKATQLVNAAIDNLCPGVNAWGHAS